MFPPPLEQTAAGTSQEQLFSQVAFGSSAMCTGALALLDLLTHLEIRPDAVVGHSNGEFAALLAAGAIDIQDEEQFLEHALRAQSVYDSFAEQMPTAKVLAIGGGDPGIVASLIQQSAGALQITIDNCPHQVVICGPEEAVTGAFDYLQKRGVICTMMPFDHAVHSPLFQPICDQIAAAHQGLKIVPPRITVYSCTTAQAQTQDPAQIRHLIMNHLARPVRFRETIENMYEAGVRIFVEVGPKGSLTSFVNDTLGKRRYVAVASNAANRSGITQLNHLIGLLVAHHVTMRLDHLYARRSPNRVSFDSVGEPNKNGSAKPRSVKLSLECPLLKLRSDGRALPPDSSANANEVVSGPIHKQNGQMRPAVIDHQPSIQAVPPGYRNGNGYTHPHPSAHGHPFLEKRLSSAGLGSRSMVMNEYLQTMEHFLEMQGAVVESFLTSEESRTSLGNDSHKKEPLSTEAEPQPPVRQAPFDIIVQSLIAGRELIATCRLDLNEHLFLRDHTLGRSPSVQDETLLALSVVPLTINMEIMAQAASLLVPGKCLVGMKNLRSYRWIDVDDRGRTISLTARVRNAAAPGEIEVRITGADDPAVASEPNLLLEATMIFADAYPVAPRVDAFACRTERPFHLRPEQYYDAMFHGPCFRSVASIDQFDHEGMQATLRTPLNARLFRSSNHADWLTDPILLDGAGQVIGFWIRTLEGFDDGAATFPVGFESLDIYRPFRYCSEPVKCTARINSLAGGRTVADIDLIGPDGELLARMAAWEDVRALGWTHRFNEFILSPREAVYSRHWSGPTRGLESSAGLQCHTVSDGPGGMWPHVLAAMILNRQEREAFRHLKKPERNRREWLLGRLAAKDAARVFIKDHYRLNLTPADIEIISDEYGQPGLAPGIVKKIGGDLSISVSHSRNQAAAIVGPREGNFGIGIAIEHLATPNERLEQIAFTPTERELLSAFPAPQKDEWLLRVWCAKEAVAKALGRGMAGDPRNLLISNLQRDTGEIIVTITGELTEQLTQFNNVWFTAQTGREADLIYAVFNGLTITPESLAGALSHSNHKPLGNFI